MQEHSRPRGAGHRGEKVSESMRADRCANVVSFKKGLSMRYELAVGGMTALMVAGAAAWGQCGQRWESTSTPPGVIGAVSDMERMPDGDVIVAGSFTHIGGLRAANLARFDVQTQTWDAFGAGADAYVWQLARLPDGCVVAAGDFRFIDTQPLTGLAVYDGVRWSPAPAAPPVRYIESMEVGPDGSLWISGFNTGPIVTGVWRGDLTTWTRVGDAPSGQLAISPTGEVALLAAHIQGPFVESAVRRWNGTTWEPLGTLLPREGETFPAFWPTSLCYTSSGVLLVSGADLLARTRAANGPYATTIRWTGSAWSPVLSSASSGSRDICARGGDSVLIGRSNGSWLTYDGVTLGTGPALQTIYTTSVPTLRDGPGGLLVGTSASAAEQSIQLTRVSDGQTSPFVQASTFNQRVTGVNVNPQGQIVVTGPFTRVGTQAAQGLAIGDGVTWSAVPVDMNRFTSRFVSASGLVVGWRTSPFYEAAVWDGQTLIDGSIGVFSVAGETRLPDGRWVFAGALQGAAQTFGLFVWDAELQQMTGVFPEVDSAKGVAAVANGDVFVLSAGGFDPRVWRVRNGVREDVSAGLPVFSFFEFPQDLLIDTGDDVYVGVTRQITPFELQTTFVRWNGSTWEAALAPIDGRIQTATGDGGSVVLAVSGNPLDSDNWVRTWPGNGVFRWENGAWQRLGDGVNGIARGIAVLPNNDVVVGGEFTRASDQAAYGVAIWRDGPRCCDSVDINDDGTVNSADVIDLLAAFAGGPCATPVPCDFDFNNDGVYPTDQDVVDFFNVLAGGACS